MMATKRFSIKLALEEVERRDLPSGSLPWPIANSPAIYGTYGQFLDSLGTNIPRSQTPVWECRFSKLRFGLKRPA